MAKFMCPFCLREYEKDEVLYYCPTCGNTSKASFLEKRTGKVICKTSGCHGYATHRKCINLDCDAGINGTDEIPKAALETQNLPFSIIGVSNSGKTNYITVMLHELGRTPGMRLVLGAQNIKTQQHQNDFYKLLYIDHQAPDATQPSEVFPQIWYVKNMQKKHGDMVPTYTFTIFDGAGESQEKMDASSIEHNYINTSKAIIITLDPLILEGVQRGGIVDPDVMKKSLAGKENEYKNAVEIVNNVAAYIKTAKGIRTDKQLSIPVAVVLTKFDTILAHNSFASNALVKRPSLTVNNGQINESEFKQVDEEIRNWLYDIGEGAFVEALDSSFKNFCFFGVSSYGAPPTQAGLTASSIKPHRVLDPIMWLFKNAGFID